MKFYFNPQAFIKNLVYLAKGMLGVLTVIIVIIIITIILNRITNKK